MEFLNYELPGKTPHDYDRNRYYRNLVVRNFCEVFPGAVSDYSRLPPSMDGASYVAGGSVQKKQEGRTDCHESKNSGIMRGQRDFSGPSFCHMV